LSALIFTPYLLYLAFSLFIYFTTLKEDRCSKFEEFPFVSIIITARNEEKNIAECLDSLTNQSYPKNQFEVIIIDDQSTDKTPDIIKTYSRSQDNFRFYKLTAGLSGRKSALIYAIKKANGEYIFQIDADCTANKNWISELCLHLEKKYAIVGGFTVIESKKRLFDNIQALEYLYMLSVGKALSRSIRTFSLFGNNMAFKKKAYRQAGGYEGIDQGILLDYQIVRAFFHHKVGKAKLIFNKNSIVTTKPMRKFKDYIEQKKRWSLGILNTISGWKFLLIPGLWMYLGAIVYPFFLKLLPVFLIIRLLADFFIILNPIRRFGRSSLILYLFFFQINLVLMLIYLGISLISSKNHKWKSRTVE